MHGLNYVVITLQLLILYTDHVTTKKVNYVKLLTTFLQY